MGAFGIIIGHVGDNDESIIYGQPSLPRVQEAEIVKPKRRRRVMKDQPLWDRGVPAGAEEESVEIEYSPMPARKSTVAAAWQSNFPPAQADQPTNQEGSEVSIIQRAIQRATRPPLERRKRRQDSGEDRW